jgi:ATP phosphoribosyltransferase regulatory subunit
MQVLAHYALDEAARARLDRISDALMNVFADGGYARIALPVLQPADLYLDMAGEDVRERMFVFEDPSGAELCLRADLTIPVCRSFIDEAESTLPARLACIGPTFRFDVGTQAELIQAGVECLGAPDALSADVEVFALARKALASSGLGPVSAEIGDLALFSALLADLKLDAIWARKLAYAFRHPSLLHPTLAEMRAGHRARPPSGAVDFAAMNLAQAERFVRERLGAGEEDAVFGRTPVEIAERLIDRAREAATGLPSADQLDAIDEFIAIVAPAGDALRRLNNLACGPAFSAVLKRFEACVVKVQGALGPGDHLRISTTLGRNFIYYSGFVFNLSVAGLDVPLAAGGRYDHLMSDLGARSPIPAVGCALWPERLLAAGAMTNG